MNENLTYSKNGLHLTEGFEGCRLTAYKDVAGVWTCGYGHTGPDVHMGQTITPEQAAAFLMQDIQVAAKAVKRLVTVPVSQNVFDSLVDFTFNCGQGNMAHSTLLRMVNTGDLKAAANEFEKWDKAGGKVVAGLLRRRQAEEAEFNG